MTSPATVPLVLHPSAVPGPGASVRLASAVLRSAHPGPTLAVTAITGLLAAAAGLPPGRAATVTTAVMTGQLTIGWGNDLVDAARDRQVGRTDKPLASQQVTAGAVKATMAATGAACVALSARVGWRSGLLNVLCGAGAGHAYNLALKATPWSWVPYASAFGTLPAVVSLAAVPPARPPAPRTLAAACLGVAAHFLNVIPDLGDDAATGVRGLPHRLGRRRSQAVATALLVGATTGAVLADGSGVRPSGWAALALTLCLAPVALLGEGRAPFRAAVAIALLDVLLLAVDG